MEFTENKSGKKIRDIMKEEDLLETHSKELYLYLKSTLRFEHKFTVKKSDLMSPNFEKILDNLNNTNENRNEPDQQIDQSARNHQLMRSNSSHN